MAERHRFVRRSDVLGLRVATLVAVGLLGTLAAIATPTASALTMLVLRAWGVPAGLSLVAALGAWLAAVLVVAYAILRAAELATTIRLPGGRIVVGAEGVSSSGWLGCELTRWRDVEAAITAADGVLLVLRGGAGVVLGTTDPAGLAASIRAARTTHSSSARAVVPDRLRPERPASRWIARVRSLPVGGAYRASAPPPCVLASVLEDADAPVWARAAAAAALLRSAPTERDRVTRARDASVDEELAVVLDDLLADRVVEARWARLARRA